MQIAIYLPIIGLMFPAFIIAAASAGLALLLLLTLRTKTQEEAATQAPHPLADER